MDIARAAAAELGSGMAGWDCDGYYDEVISFMRGVLGRVLKGNAHLEKAVLTGILRVAKESIFSGLNNVLAFSLLDPPFADKFGFTEQETERLLALAGLEDQLAAVRDWYNGYLIGETVIYNPWSLVNFLNAADQGCRPYWVNTSANLLVHDQLLHASSRAQDALKSLLNGAAVETSIHDQTVFRDIKQDEEPALVVSAVQRLSHRPGLDPGGTVAALSPQGPQRRGHGAVPEHSCVQIGVAFCGKQVAVRARHVTS